MITPKLPVAEPQPAVAVLWDGGRSEVGLLNALSGHTGGSGLRENLLQGGEQGGS